MSIFGGDSTMARLARMALELPDDDLRLQWAAVMVATVLERGEEPGGLDSLLLDLGERVRELQAEASGL